MEEGLTLKAHSAGAGFLALRAVCRNLGDGFLAPDLARGVLKHRRLARSLALQRECAGQEFYREHAACPLCDVNERLLRRHQRVLAALAEHEDPHVRRAAMRALEAAVREGEMPLGWGTGRAAGRAWRALEFLRRLLEWAGLRSCARPPGGANRLAG